MHLFMDIPFEKTTPEEMMKILSEKGIKAEKCDKYTLKAESLNCFDEICHLTVSFRLGTPSFGLTIDMDHTGVYFPGSLSRQYTHDYMAELFKKMKAEFGDPDYIYRGTWIENNNNGGFKLSGRLLDTDDSFDPHYGGEFIEAVFDNVTLHHGYFYNETNPAYKDLTSTVSVTYYPEKRSMPDGVY